MFWVEANAIARGSKALVEKRQNNEKDDICLTVWHEQDVLNNYICSVKLTDCNLNDAKTFT